MTFRLLAVSTFLLIMTLTNARAQDLPTGFIHDESLVPEYELPDLFLTESGHRVTTPAEWEAQRRPEIARIFEREVYGHLPRDHDSVTFSATPDADVLDGRARMRRVDITTTRGGNSFTFPLFVFLPAEARRPLPAFLLISYLELPFMQGADVESTPFLPIEAITEQGFAAAVFHVSAVTPDDTTTYREGVLEALFPDQIDEPHGTGAISSWAWAAMRSMDYFEHTRDINHEQVALVGHSRGGKTALWAGAMDDRFAITISNQSGAVGAALSRRMFGETIRAITSRFGYWFAPHFARYADNEAELPVDQHALIALIAPRAVYVASAEDDAWADPRGEYLGLYHGSRVYSETYGHDISLPDEPPAVHEPIHHNYLGYHIREGVHGLERYDWQQYIRFAADHFNMQLSR